MRKKNSTICNKWKITIKINPAITLLLNTASQSCWLKAERKSDPFRFKEEGLGPLKDIGHKCDDLLCVLAETTPELTTKQLSMRFPEMTWWKLVSSRKWLAGYPIRDPHPWRLSAVREQDLFWGGLTPVGPEVGGDHRLPLSFLDIRFSGVWWMVLAGGAQSPDRAGPACGSLVRAADTSMGTALSLHHRLGQGWLCGRGTCAVTQHPTLGRAPQSHALLSPWFCGTRAGRLKRGAWPSVYQCGKSSGTYLNRKSQVIEQYVKYDSIYKQQIIL